MKKVLLLYIALLLSLASPAKEGMWIPHLLEQIHYSEMQRMGLQISADDIWSVNHSSLKDAIVHFNGGCTSSLISSQGLLLTNHHCGYRQIQKHSSLENNYLKDGFWAERLTDEKINEGSQASIVQYMEDVTNSILKGTTAQDAPQIRDSIIAQNIQAELALQRVHSDLAFEVKPFFYGNQYLLIAKRVFFDIRLVGAPPSSIGKFGADTDNWMWPRHTGDFSLFRIYTDRNNEPAPISEDNVPYRPEKHLKINLNGFQPGDFTMVYGFPGSTQQYLPASEVEHIVHTYNPQRIAIRTEILEVLDEAMRKDEATAIQYAAKYAGISNSWKRWKGEIKGLTETGAIEAIKKEESLFHELLLNSRYAESYSGILAKLDSLYTERVPLVRERYAYIEIGYYGLEFMRHLLRYKKLIDEATEENPDAAALAVLAKNYERSSRNFLSDYQAGLGVQVAQVILPQYLNTVESEPLPEEIAVWQSLPGAKQSRAIQKMYAGNIILRDTARWYQLLREKPVKAAKKLAKDPAYRMAQAMYQHFDEVLRPAFQTTQDEIDELQRDYIQALQLVQAKKTLYPDANSTIRLAYGQVRPYEPRDGVTYHSQTFLKGVMEKYVPGDYEFDVPEKLQELYERKDFGSYGQKGQMPVCFIATNHTTGGNSGSPVLNGRGELIGLNFDRAWEGTMSDLYFDKRICRNIMVDLRYVLFIVDKFAGAERLIQELDMVKAQPRALPEAEPALSPAK